MNSLYERNKATQSRHKAKKDARHVLQDFRACEASNRVEHSRSPALTLTLTLTLGERSTGVCSSVAAYPARGPPVLLLVSLIDPVPGTTACER